MASCKECLFELPCSTSLQKMYHNKAERCPFFKNKADVAEVKHGKWHILPEDSNDESGCPTEEGWYRIITYDGEEMTDYFFGKPTLIGMGLAYWKNCEKIIRAWAKMDEGSNQSG